MKIQPTAPGLYKPIFDVTDNTPLTRAAQSWSWYRLRELIQVVNAQHEGLEFTGGLLLKNFNALCGLCNLEPVITVLYLESLGGYELNYLGAHKYFEYRHCGDPDCYIPAGWGKRILEVIRRGPVYKLNLIQLSEKMPSLNAFDVNGNFMFELPMGNIPILDPNKYTEP